MRHVAYEASRHGGKDPSIFLGCVRESFFLATRFRGYVLTARAVEERSSGKNLFPPEVWPNLFCLPRKICQRAPEEALNLTIEKNCQESSLQDPQFRKETIENSLSGI